MRNKRTSLTDLAKELGISITTVSFVLNGRAEEMKISKETQERVLALAKERNYRPNALARSLRLGRSQLVGLLVPNISDPFFAYIARQLEDYAAKHDYRVIFGSTDEDPQRERELAETMRNQSIDGLLIVSADLDNEYIKQLADDNFPIVLLDRASPDLPISSVVVDNVGGFCKLTEQLIEKGCKRPAMMTMPESVLTLIRRKEGYVQAMEKHQLEQSPDLIANIDAHSMKESIKAELDRLFSLPEPIDGLVFANNVLASRTIWALNMFFKDKMESIKLASFDNADLFDYSTPPVTSMEQPLNEMAEESFDLLLRTIKDPKSKPEHREMPLKVIPR